MRVPRGAAIHAPLCIKDIGYVILGTGSKTFKKSNFLCYIFIAFGNVVSREGNAHYLFSFEFLTSWLDMVRSEYDISFNILG